MGSLALLTTAMGVYYVANSFNMMWGDEEDDVDYQDIIQDIIKPFFDED